MVPSGDDGVATVEEGFALCRQAAKRGTYLLYGTPHVNDDLPLTSERERIVRGNAKRLTELLHAMGLELRVGFELHPSVALRDADLRRYRLDGFDAVLLECPLETTQVTASTRSSRPPIGSSQPVCFRSWLIPSDLPLSSPTSPQPGRPPDEAGCCR
jgi:hypothetical protein